MQARPFETVIADEAGMCALAVHLADRLPVGGGEPVRLVTLSGELGAGKTVLARAWLRAYGHLGTVRSPTYTLVESYVAGARRVAHLDLYRLNHPDELDALGYRDVLATHELVLVEWPSRVDNLGPADLAIEIELRDHDRRVVIDGPLAACLA